MKVKVIVALFSISAVLAQEDEVETLEEVQEPEQ